MMTIVRSRFFLLSVPFAAALALAACDDDNDTSLPAAPREPITLTAATATPTPPPADPTRGPDTGGIVGFLGRIHTIDGTRIGIREFDVLVDGDTSYFRNGQASSLEAFSVGEDVRVAGRMVDDRTMAALKISLLPDATPTAAPTDAPPAPPVPPASTPTETPTATASPTATATATPTATPTP